MPEPTIEAPKQSTKGRQMADDWIKGLPVLGVEEPAKAPEAPTAPIDPPAPKDPPQVIPEPKKATPEPEPAKPETDEDKWPRSNTDWERLKAKNRERVDKVSKERDEIKAERDRISLEIAELKKVGPSPELDNIKKEREELSEKLRILDIERHPRFQKFFQGKIDAQVELAKRIVGGERSDKISKLLTLPESDFKTAQIDELVNELTPMQQARIGSVLNTLEEINYERSTEITKAREDYNKIAELQKTTAEKAKQDSESNNLKAFEGVLQSAQDPKDGLFTFQAKTGDDEWNKGVTARIESAKALLFGQTSPEVMIQAAMKAVSLPAVLASHKALHEENAKLQAQVKELQAAGPKAGGNGGSAPSSGQSNGGSANTTQNRLSPTRKITADWMGELEATKRQLSEE